MTGAPIAVTMGDPAGIGPEITARAWQALRDGPPFYLIGNESALRAQSDIPVTAIATPNEAAAVMPSALPLLPVDLPQTPTPGQPALANAPAVVAAIETAVAHVHSGAATALVTNPIAKSVLIDGAAFAHPGHTEFLAHLAGSPRAVMMLAAPELKVVPVTIHIPLSEVPAALTADLLEDTLRITAAAMTRDFGLATPRIAVAGLNPHAGEDGKMGTEEARLITPVLDRLRAEGLTISGPLPADTMFHAAARACYDVAVAMYHDQALIPIKTLNFSGGVNCTLGLPFIRTSPDHGTAFGIAGQGRADPESLIAAIRLARDMADRRARA